MKKIEVSAAEAELIRQSLQMRINIIETSNYVLSARDAHERDLPHNVLDYNQMELILVINRLIERF